MTTKSTYSRSVVWNPDQEGNTAKQIATSGREVSALKLATTGAGPALVYLYDSTNSGGANPSTLRWVMDSASGTPDGNEFSSGLSFKNGIYAVLVQGAGLGAILCVAYYPSEV